MTGTEQANMLEQVLTPAYTPSSQALQNFCHKPDEVDWTIHPLSNHTASIGRPQVART
jgi:hypothetical protein